MPKHSQIGFLVLIAVSGALAQQPIAFQYFYDDVNQLVKVVDSTGVVVQYVYDSVGNILQINRSSTAAGTLAIFNVTPTTVVTGGTITIQGQGFSTTPSLNIVTIGGVAVTVVSATSAVLVVAVSANAVSGLLMVRVGSVTATAGTNETITAGHHLSDAENGSRWHDDSNVYGCRQQSDRRHLRVSSESGGHHRSVHCTQWKLRHDDCDDFTRCSGTVHAGRHQRRRHLGSDAKARVSSRDADV